MLLSADAGWWGAQVGINRSRCGFSTTENMRSQRPRRMRTDRRRCNDEKSYAVRVEGLVIAWQTQRREEMSAFSCVA